MKKSSLSFLLLLLVSFSLLSGCKLFRTIGGDKGSEAAGYELAREIAANPVLFEEIAINGKADIRTPDMGLGASYRIQVQKDQQILIRISKIVEVFRILVRTDSIFVLDKLNQHYYACDYSLAKQYLGVDANFAMIQALLLGDYYPIPAKMTLGSPPKDNPLKFSGMLIDTRLDYYLDRELRKLVRMSVTNPKLEGQSETWYEDFDKVDGQDFPMTIRLEVPAPLDGQITFNHKRVQINPGNLNFDFDGPQNYIRQDCP